MYLDGEPISKYGGCLEAGFTVSGVPVSSLYTQGARTSSFVMLRQKLGLKEIKCPVVFNGPDPQVVRERYSHFIRLALGDKKEMILPDGRQYTVILQNIGTEQWLTQNDMAVDLTFIGYCHGDLQVITGSRIHCMSTMPYTDCILRVTVTSAAPRYQLATVTFLNASVGDRLVVDGINKRILINDAPAAQRAEWIRFPALEPGENLITCNDTVTVEYYPVYF